MAVLFDLPPELVLKMLSILPIYSLHAMRLLSHDWNQFFLTHENSIYYQASLLHQFVPTSVTSLDDAKALYPGHLLTNVFGWFDFCRLVHRLHETWSGYGDIGIEVYQSSTRHVHRLKVDEKVGIVITSHSTGGISVCDIADDTLLWDLEPRYVRPWAHVEYGNGFLIFDRYGECKEVWRLASDYDSATVPKSFPPDSEQIRQGLSSEARHSRTNKRGHFKPWALLRSSQWGRAFRFVYPTLLVGSFSSAYVFNVESAELIQVVENTQLIDGNPLGEIHYVEVNSRHIFICGSIELRIFDRANGALVFRLSPTFEAQWTQLRVINASSSGSRAPRVHPLSVVPYKRKPTSGHSFIGVHVSGRDMVVLREDGRFLFIRDYEEAIQNKKPLSNFLLAIALDEQWRSMYMAFENGRLALATTAGLFVFTLDATAHNPDTRLPVLHEPTDPILHTYPLALRVCKVFPLDHYPALDQVSCLQMTTTRLFLTYHPLHVPLDARSRLPGPSGSSQTRNRNTSVRGNPPSYVDGLEDWYDDDDDGDDEGNWTDEDPQDGINWELRSVVCVDFSPD